jgi:hypothetical protein
MSGCEELLKDSDKVIEDSLALEKDIKKIKEDL